MPFFLMYHSPMNLAPSRLSYGVLSVIYGL